MPISRRKILKIRDRDTQGLVLCEAKTERSEPGVARAKGMAIIIFFILLFIWAFPLCGRRLSGFTGSVF